MKNVAVLGMAALFLVACDTGGDEAQELRVQAGEPGTISIEDAGEVHMSFSEEEATLTEGDAIEVVLENDTDEPLSMGRQYYVEFYEDEETWTEIEISLFFTQDIVVVEPGDEHLFDMVLVPEGDSEEVDTPEFETGQYRLRKEFSIGDEAEIDELEISVAFDLEVE